MSEADIQQAIRQKNVPALLALMFEPGAGTEPSLSTGRRTENVLWDFKRGCPSASKKHERAWATIARHVLAFHNSGGGVLFFGIDDHSYEFVGTRDRVDSKGFNDQVRRYLGDAIWVEFHREYIQSDQRYLGVAIIPPRGVGLARFVASAPSGDNGDQEFETGESALRRGDSSLVISSQEASQWERQSAVRTLGQTYAVDESYFRLLYPSYETFVTRQELCQEVLQAMRDPRTSITSLIGIGGVGKTALATWAAIHHYEEGTYPFIVSITGRDRELTPWGIHSIDANLSTYETLLDEILEVLGFSDHLEEETPYKEQTVRTLLTESEGLLVVDNLETVDDARVVSFLDSLPPGVSALTTSRRGSVRVAVRPVNVGPMTNAEVARLVKALSVSPELTYAVGLSSTEIARLASACDGIALAIKWAMQRSASAPELLEFVGGLSSLSAKDDELLEFCFRRIYERMTAVEKAIMQVLSLFQRPQYSEAIVVGSGKRADAVHDALAALVEDALVQRAFDPDRNDHVFSLMPITRAFAHSRWRYWCDWRNPAGYRHGPAPSQQEPQKLNAKSVR